MRDFEDSTLWRVSAFERVRQATGDSGFVKLGGVTVLPTTLLNDLNQLERNFAAGDALEVIAACMRHREAALLYLQHEELVWPVTLFPSDMIYHSPRDMLQASTQGLADLQVIAVEPPGVRPPGHWMHERVGQACGIAGLDHDFGAREHDRDHCPESRGVLLHGPAGRHAFSNCGQVQRHG